MGLGTERDNSDDNDTDYDNNIIIIIIITHTKWCMEGGEGKGAMRKDFAI